MNKPVDKSLDAPIIDVRIMFKNMEHQKPLHDFAGNELKKIEQLLQSERMPITVNLVIEESAVHANNRVEILVSTADFSLIANHEGADIKEEIIKVIDRMIESIRTAKERKAEEQKTKDSYKSA